MSVFKRLSNVARGKMKELGKTLESGFPESYADPAADPMDPDRPSASRHVTPPPPSTSDKRAMLERLHEEGLLTDDEFAEKLAALEAPSKVLPKKRRL